MNGAATTTKITAEEIIDTITAAGLDYHDFKISSIEFRIALGVDCGQTVNVWEEIAEMGRTNAPEDAVERAWELSGLQNPYAEEEAA